MKTKTKVLLSSLAVIALSTSIASGAFMTMVCGGGILIPLQGKLADVFGSFEMSYVVVLLCAAYILYYALIGYKNVNTDIPVE